MSESVKKYIQEQFEKARQQPVAPVSKPKPTANTQDYYTPVIELVQPVAEPTTPRHKPVLYSNQNVYEISQEVRRESLDQLFERCVKSLKY